MTPMMKHTFACNIVISGTTGCWLHQSRDLSPSGYARAVVDGKRYMVHRYTYEVYNGPLKDGMHVHHTCGVRTCCNPAHLEQVTPRENVMASPTSVAAINAAKTHCPKGHDYETHAMNRSNGKRDCKQCALDRYYAQKTPKPRRTTA